MDNVPVVRTLRSLTGGSQRQAKRIKFCVGFLFLSCPLWTLAIQFSAAVAWRQGYSFDATEGEKVGTACLDTEGTLLLFCFFGSLMLLEMQSNGDGGAVETGF